MPGAALITASVSISEPFPPLDPLRMPNEPPPSSPRALEPYDRVSEVLFGLVMVLTFTGSLSVAQAGREDVHAMLIGALGCNLAWGFIDAMLYLMGCLAEKGQGLITYRALRRATDPRQAQRLIADALPPIVASVVTAAELQALQQRLQALPDPPKRARLNGTEWLGGLAVFALVFATTFPVALPFVFLRDAGIAMRVSNAIAIVLLFVTGYAFGRTAGLRPWLVGILMVLLGLLFVAMTILLGG